jgi:hypothetical protein
MTGRSAKRLGESCARGCAQKFAIFIIFFGVEYLFRNLVALLQQSADLGSRQPLIESAPSFGTVVLEQRLVVLIDYFLDLFIKPLQLARIERCDVFYPMGVG